MNRRREKDHLKEEITQGMLSHISAMVDVTESFDAIDSLNGKIENLGKHQMNGWVGFPSQPFQIRRKRRMPSITPNQRLIAMHRERFASDFLGIKNSHWQAAMTLQQTLLQRRRP